jgi:hypothetical protein
MSTQFAPSRPLAFPSYEPASGNKWWNDAYADLPAFGAPVVFRKGERDSMREGLRELVEILTWQRPHDSDAEKQFTALHIVAPIAAMGIALESDGFGNLWAHIDSDNLGPVVLWSCHIDTMAAKGGKQDVRYSADKRLLELTHRKPGRVLGADDGAGIFLLLEMMRARIPGGYVFHRGEEKGRLGSEYVAAYEPERLNRYDACLAFDRRDCADVITFQSGQRCASEVFAETFADALNQTGQKFAYRADDSGSYTDSYSYLDLISECTNISVGYDSEHSSRETLDCLHVWRLRKALLRADFSGENTGNKRGHSSAGIPGIKRGQSC